MTLTFASSLFSAETKALPYGLTVVLAVIICVLTLLPQSMQPPSSHGFDKLYHVTAFAGLMLPIATLRPRALVWMIPAALLLGAGIEVIQPFVNRSRDLADFWADAVGVLIGSVLGFALHWFGVRKLR
jgi:VanZ family protein